MIVTPTNKSATELEGLHLYHADMSNCSMRVRMTLEEKDLLWTSHHLDLRKKEAVTPDYVGIHPKGLVPTLVHDGVVHIESNEIIEYLDETFPDPPLQPKSPKERDEMRDWLRTATEIHIPAVKTLIYTRKIGKVLRKNEEEDAKYRSLQRDPELLAFHAAATANRLAEGKCRQSGGHAVAPVRQGRDRTVAARMVGRRPIFAGRHFLGAAALYVDRGRLSIRSLSACQRLGGRDP